MPLDFDYRASQMIPAAILRCYFLMELWEYLIVPMLKPLPAGCQASTKVNTFYHPDSRWFQIPLHYHIIIFINHLLPLSQHDKLRLSESAI